MKIHNPLAHKVAYFVAAPDRPPRRGDIPRGDSVDLPEFSNVSNVLVRLVILGANEVTVAGNAEVTLGFTVKIP